MRKDIPISCNRDCGAGCPLIARVENGKIVKIFDNPARGPGITGCVRGYRALETLYSPQRIKMPLLRTGERGSGNFKEIAWNEALQRIAENLASVRDADGADAILALAGSGSCQGAVHNTSLTGKRFFAQFGSCLTWGNYSCQAMGFTLPFVFGTEETGLDAGTLEKSNLIIIWGGNFCSTRFGAALETSLKKAKEKGCEIIVIDPRRRGTVKKLGTRWISIYPGTDTAMMAAVLHVLISENLADRSFLDRYTVGFDDVETYIAGTVDGIPKTPEWAAPLCGVSAETIIQLARTYGRAKPAALLPGFSFQRNLGGEDAVRFAAILQAATGNIGAAGGSSGGQIWGGLSGPSFPSLPVPAVPAERSIPVYLWADTVLERNMKGIYCIGVNYLNQGSDIKKNLQAFQQADFVFTHELFLTPTARYSDIVLPSTFYLEREDVIFPAENYLYYSTRAAEPMPESRNDYDILADLAELLGFGETFTQGKTASQWLEDFFPASDIDDAAAFRETGIYDGGSHMRTGLADFVKDPDSSPLPTPSGKIELSSSRFEENGFHRYPLYAQETAPDGYPLRLVSPHARNRVNSQNSNIPWRRKDGAELLEMHPEDGKARGIAGGQRVSVSSPDGELTAEVKLTEDMKPGVICLRQGTWLSRSGTGDEGGASVNLLTSTRPTMPSFGSRTHSVWTEVTPLDNISTAEEQRIYKDQVKG